MHGGSGRAGRKQEGTEKGLKLLAWLWMGLLKLLGCGCDRKAEQAGNRTGGMGQSCGSVPFGDLGAVRRVRACACWDTDSKGGELADLNCFDAFNC